MLAHPRKSMAHAHNAHLAAAKQAAAIAAAAGLSGSNHLHPGSTDKGGGSSGAGQILMHSGASRTLGGGTAPRTGRAWQEWPKPFNHVGAALDALMSTWDAVTSDHLRNNRVLCVCHTTVLLALIIESYVTVPAVPDSLIARDGIAAWTVPKWNGRVIWFLQLCTTLIALAASTWQISAATNAYRYQVMFHLAVTMVIGSVGVIIYMIYGNAWQLGEILCGTTRQLVCTDTDWGTKIISEAWHWRYVVFLVSQALTVQGIVTHLLELLAMHRDSEKKNDVTNQPGGGTSRVVLAQY
ncbi:hypothetical protein GGF32_002761 [Allomyces javanicus]|nr:hypothetical protein GGF32_002761 [Allomyces javanicus]